MNTRKAGRKALQVSSARAVRVHAAGERETRAVERALNAVQGCSFNSRSAYIWPLEVASDGWAVGTPEARNPIHQGDGVVILHYYSGRWHYITCGSDFGTYPGQPPGYPPFPAAVINKLLHAFPVIRAHRPGPGTAHALAAITTNTGWCPDAGQSFPLEVTNVGWATAMLDGTPGFDPDGGCVVIYRYQHHAWRVFTHGFANGIWTSARNVPAVVLFHLEDGVNRAVGVTCPPRPDLCLAQ